MTQRITINPITRLEGHGKIEIFLNKKGEVDDAFWQVNELRGFERFCLVRPAEEMTRIVPNICGVCPSAHHVAATKALDALYGVEPTPTAKLIRQLEFNAFYLEDHYIHFFFLPAPDFIMGPDADPAERNILGVIGRMGKEVGQKVIEVRKRNRDIIRHIFSKAPHPEGGLPGGVPRGITEEDRKWINSTAEFSLEFAQFAVKLFKDLVVHNKKYLDIIKHDMYSLKTYYMALVDEDNKVSFYDGKVTDNKQPGISLSTRRSEPRGAVDRLLASMDAGDLSERGMDPGCCSWCTGSTSARRASSCWRAIRKPTDCSRGSFRRGGLKRPTSLLYGVIPAPGWGGTIGRSHRTTGIAGR